MPYDSVQQDQDQETVSETLEHAFAGHIGDIQEFIDLAPGLYPGSPERLAELVRLARTLKHKVECLAYEIDKEQENGTDAEPEAPPPANGNRAFDDEHFILLRGIVRAANDVFREVNEPEEGGINGPAVAATCVLQVLADQLERALAVKGGAA